MIDLNMYHIKATLKNNRREEVAVKLPNSVEGLEQSLILNKITDEDNLGYENFELKIKSILALERIDTIKIKAPLNIYYLNMYLNLLKEKNIKLDTKEDEWNTEIIKSRIAELLNTNSMNYDDFVNYITDTKTQEQKNEAEPNDTKEDKPKKKPMYTIAELQKRHLERKRGND